MNWRLQGEEVMLLQHMVLSHHGKEEWGSPKRPMLKEAEILHYIDNIDAKMNMLDRALVRRNLGSFRNEFSRSIIVHFTNQHLNKIL